MYVEELTTNIRVLIYTEMVCNNGVYEETESVKHDYSTLKPSWPFLIRDYVEHVFYTIFICGLIFRRKYFTRSFILNSLPPIRITRVARQLYTKSKRRRFTTVCSKQNTPVKQTPAAKCPFLLPNDLLQPLCRQPFLHDIYFELARTRV